MVELRPGQLDLPGVRLAGRLESRVRRGGKRYVEVVYLVSSHTLEELEAQGMLQAKRRYWVVESRLHHCLDVSLREDFSRVRQANAMQLLGSIRRLIVSLANAAVNRARRRNPKSKFNTRSFQKRFRSHQAGPRRLHALIFAKHPDVLDLQP